MTVETRWTTVEELLRMPADGFRYELVRGELKKMPPAGDEHGYVAGEVFAELRNHVKAGNLGRTYAAETGFVISRNPDTVLSPTRPSSTGSVSRRLARPEGTSPARRTSRWRYSPRTIPTPRSRRKLSPGSTPEAAWY